MTGFEAIAHHNGWVMAAFGATIVFSGLAVLSFVISQLPKVFALFEEKVPAEAEAPPPEPPPTEEPSIPPPKSGAPCTDPAYLAAVVDPIAARLEQPFPLSELYQRCRERDLPHPHLTLNCLRREGYLMPQGEGSFTWRANRATEQEG